MGYKRQPFTQQGFDIMEWQRAYHRHQESYLRKRLTAVKAYACGKDFEEIHLEYGIGIQSVRKYINLYLDGGMDNLCKKVVREQPKKLSPIQEAEFKATLLSKKPKDVGMEGNIWTGKIMQDYVQKNYQVIYKGGIYDLLERLNLTHQKAHSDYGNADIDAQRIYVEELKEALLAADEHTAVVKFDEFSVGQQPTSFYGWAEKNTRPTFVTNEKKKTG